MTDELVRFYILIYGVDEVIDSLFANKTSPNVLFVVLTLVGGCDILFLIIK